MGFCYSLLPLVDGPRLHTTLYFRKQFKMKISFGGFIIGLILGVAFTGWQWKSVVTSGDYFTVGSKFYACEAHEVVIK